MSDKKAPPFEPTHEDIDNPYRLKPTDVVMKGDLNKLLKLAVARRERNQAFYGARKGMVCTPQGLVEPNPEYVQRAQVTKALKKAYENYSVSKYLANDYVFNLKKSADENGQDFTKAAEAELLSIKGHQQLVTLPDAVIPQPKRSLASRLLHQLWKMGLPVEKLIGKELSVDEADK